MKTPSYAETVAWGLLFGGLLGLLLVCLMTTCFS